MARLLARLVAMNDGWAQPLGDFNHRWLTALFRPIRPVKDLLNGTLARPPAPCGGDRPPDRRCSRPRSSWTSSASPPPRTSRSSRRSCSCWPPRHRRRRLHDTDGTARTRATTHATLMVVALVVLLVSLATRAGDPADRTVPIALSILGFLS